MNKPRLAIGALTLAASTLVSLAISEGWEPVARPPIPGDVPTGGFGATVNEDGSPVRHGQVFTPDRALILLLNDANKFQRALKNCAPVPMHPYEFSAFVQLAYNVGDGAVCNSSIPRLLKAGDYLGACKKILEFNKFRDCTQPRVFNSKTQKWECPLVPLRGLTLRREREYKECIGENQT